MDRYATDGSHGARLRRCFLASIVYCPMVGAERDGDDCAGCEHFCGTVNEGGFLAVKCSWEPKDSNVIRPEFRAAA